MSTFFHTFFVHTSNLLVVSPSKYQNTQSATTFSVQNVLQIVDNAVSVR